MKAWYGSHWPLLREVCAKRRVHLTPYKSEGYFSPLAHHVMSRSCRGSQSSRGVNPIRGNRNLLSELPRAQVPTYNCRRCGFTSDPGVCRGDWEKWRHLPECCPHAWEIASDRAESEPIPRERQGRPGRQTQVLALVLHCALAAIIGWESPSRWSAVRDSRGVEDAGVGVDTAQSMTGNWCEWLGLTHGPRVRWYPCRPWFVKMIICEQQKRDIQGSLGIHLGDIQTLLSKYLDNIHRYQTFVVQYTCHRYIIIGKVSRFYRLSHLMKLTVLFSAGLHCSKFGAVFLMSPESAIVRHIKWKDTRTAAQAAAEAGVNSEFTSTVRLRTVNVIIRNIISN